MEKDELRVGSVLRKALNYTWLHVDRKLVYLRCSNCVLKGVSQHICRGVRRGSVVKLRLQCEGLFRSKLGTKRFWTG